MLVKKYYFNNLKLNLPDDYNKKILKKINNLFEKN